MGPPVTNLECRGSKRRRKFGKNAADVHEPGRQPKKRALQIRGVALVGRYVLKEFDENGVFLGKIVSYDSGLYRIDYEDGDCEDLDSGEVSQFLIGDEYFDDELLERRKRLDDFLENNTEKVDQSQNGDMNKVETLTPNSFPDGDGRFSSEAGGNETDDDVDLCSNSSEYSQDLDFRTENEAPTAPPPELPPSSGTIGLPEDCVPYLFSVYGFLRSFSVSLFLTPFTLDDLVGCLNCSIPNILLDAIHVALLRILRRHLETLSSDGSEYALECLSCADWTLLDVLTWPMYIVYYFMKMKRLNGAEWKGFYSDVLKKDYCMLAVGMKLKVLQILCDDALETAEIRAEIDMREESEVGITSDEDPDFPSDNGVIRVNHRYSKLSFSKDREAMAVSSNPCSTAQGGSASSGNAAADEDRNSDECRLCGMDGTLLCCDGCPSAYHSRCIGVSKTFVPEGPWLCPECTISRIGPPIAIGTSLKGAEVFGNDAYGQVFMGTCNHLVVLKISEDSVPFARYYNHTDIPTVLRALNLCIHHAVLYSGMCKSILKYWGIPEDVLPLPHKVQPSIDSDHQKDEAATPSTLHPSAENGVMKDFGKESMVDKMISLSSKCGFNEVPVDSLTRQADFASVSLNCDAAERQNCRNIVTHGISEDALGDSSMFSASVSQYAVLSGLAHQGLKDGSNLREYDLNAAGQSNNSSGGNKNGVSLRIKFSFKKEGSNGVGTNDQISKASCLYMGSTFKPHAYINSYVHGDFAASAAANLSLLSSEENRAPETRVFDNPRKAISANISLQSKAFSSASVRFFWPSTEKKLFEVPRERCGWCLSCQGSITSKKACLLNAAALNATRAATKFFSGLRLSKNVEGSLYSIVMYALYLEESLHGLLVGPFQSAMYRLQWRKQVELSSSCGEIKARLLELEGSLRTISLSGDWIKLVDGGGIEPSTIQTTTAPGSTQKRGPGRPSNQTTSAAGSAQKRGPGRLPNQTTSVAGSAQKRGPGRPPKKHLCTSEVTSDNSGESSNDFSWWRGRNYSKLIFQRGMLPHTMVKKTARLGGIRKIIGLHYADSSDIPKISRQLIWRAAVETSKNASHLGLQVRYLDNHIRWSDLVRPEQCPQDAKGLETEASSFRNAFICDKRIAENKVMYGVVFGHQRHLPSRLMKSIIEKEETQDGKDKYWFLETRIPLYLIREYEQQQQQQQPEKPVSAPENKPSCNLSSLQKKQLKKSRSKLTYLVRRRDNMGACCFCASCRVDVLLKNAVKCSTCEGYCHGECTISSTVQANEDIEYIVTCQTCIHAKTVAQNKNVESPTSPLALQGQEYQNVLSASNSVKQRHGGKQLPVGTSAGISKFNGSSFVKDDKQKLNGKQQLPTGTPESVSDVKALSAKKKGKKRNSSDLKQLSSTTSLNSNKKKKLCSLGLIWKKNKKNEPEETGTKFRREHILMKGNPDNMDVSEVQCRLCQKKYDPCYMFIHCETCNFWYHAKAVELEEAKLPDLVGFKCCKCRRIKIPRCRVGEETQAENDELSELGKGVESFSGSMSEQAESSIPTTPMTPIEDDVYIELDDPLLSSVQVEDIPELTTEMGINWDTPAMLGPQKLPVRRQNLKHEDFDSLAQNNLSEAEPPLPLESNGISEPAGNLPPSPHAEWDMSTGVEDEMQFDYDKFNYEDSEYEPQTYFSFTELLASDDASQPGVGASENMPDAWEHWAGETSQGNTLDQCEIEAVQSCSERMEPMFSDGPAFDMICQICAQTDPVPELICRNCGVQIHSHCSPWEELPQEDGWRCGNCRAWW